MGAHFITVVPPGDVRPAVRRELEEAKVFAERDLGVEFEAVYFREVDEALFRLMRSHDAVAASIALWSGQSYEKRFDVVALDEPVWGLYWPRLNWVLVDVGRPRGDVVRTLLHEARHCHQHTVEHPGASKADLDVLLGNDEVERQAEAYAADAWKRFRARRRGGGWMPRKERRDAAAC